MLDSGWADEVSTGFVGVLLDCSLEEPASVKLLGLAGSCTLSYATAYSSYLPTTGPPQPVRSLPWSAPSSYADLRFDNADATTE